METGLKKTRLTDRQRELVRLMQVGHDNRAVYGSDEVIADWAALKKVMIALGGTWKKGGRGAKGGFVFGDDVDAAEMIRLAGETGEILDPNAHDFFPTPAGLADALVAKLDLKPGERVLEPSAGRGALVAAVRRVTATIKITCFELLPTNVRVLQEIGSGIDVFERDFLSVDPEPARRGHFWGNYDAMPMNPPFGKRADIRHVTHALGFLRSGGRLAAIMSVGVAFRDDRLAKAFRALVEANDGTIEPNPPGSFRESGTMVNTVTVTMRKAG